MFTLLPPATRALILVNVGVFLLQQVAWNPMLVLLAFAWYFPRQRLFVIPIPIPVPAWLFVTVYALAELLYGVTGRQQGVAHFAHLGGMLGGALCILYWRARRRFSS